MAHDIVTRATFGSALTSDIALDVSGDANADAGWYRTLSVGSAWSKIRVGVQYAITPNGTSNFTSGFIVVSINAGMSVFPRDASPTGSYFAALVAGGDTVTYNAGAGNPYFMSTRTFVGRKIGASQTLETQDLTDHYIPATTGAIQRRGCAFVDFDIFTGKVSIWIVNTASHAQVDVNTAAFNTALALDGIPSPNGNAMYLNTNPGTSVSHSTGALTTVGVYSAPGNTAAHTEIYNVGVQKFF